MADELHREAGRLARSLPQPGLIDRAIMRFAPQWGLKRYEAHLKANRVNQRLGAYGYDAGSNQPVFREWHSGLGDADADSVPQLDTIRSRSRDLVRNSPVGTAAVGAYETHIIGTGLKLHAMPDRRVLGLTEQQADEIQTELESLWECVADNLDFESPHTDQASLQRLVVRSQFESGDLLVVRRQDRRVGDLLGMKVMLVEADRVRSPEDRVEDDRLRGGVETTPSGRVVAYHVRDRHPGDLYLRGAMGSTRVPVMGRGGRMLSRLIMHKNRPGQRRGIPVLAPVMEVVKQGQRLTKAELNASVMTSAFALFVESESAGGGIPQVPVGWQEEAPQRADEVYLPNGAVMVDLMPGEKIQPVTPNRPNDLFAPFWESLQEQTGMGTLIPYEVLVRRYQNSYSAARAALLDAQRFWNTREHFVGKNFLDLLYEWVLWEAIARGMIDLPGFVDDPIRRKAWLRAKWVGDGRGAINETDQARAAQMRIDMGVSNRQIEAIRINGSDWARDVQPQRQREKAILDEAGMPFSATQASAAAGDDQEEAEDPANDDPMEGAA